MSTRFVTKASNTPVARSSSTLAVAAARGDQPLIGIRAVLVKLALAWLGTLPQAVVVAGAGDGDVCTGTKRFPTLAGRELQGFASAP